MDSKENSSPIPPEHMKPQKGGRDFENYTLKSAREKLASLGFIVNESETRNHGIGAILYRYTNPNTNQKANLSHHYQDKKGRPIDKATIAFFQIDPLKRRTKEEKERASMPPLYD